MSVSTMGPEPIWGSTSNVHSLDRFRASAGSSQSHSWAVSITVMNALQRNDLAADAVLANDRRAKWVGKGEPLAQLQFIDGLFGLAIHGSDQKYALVILLSAEASRLFNEPFGDSLERLLCVPHNQSFEPFPAEVFARTA